MLHSLFLSIIFMAGIFSNVSQATCIPEPESFFERWLPNTSYRSTREAQDFLERNTKDYPLRIYEAYRHILPDVIIDTNINPEVKFSSDRFADPQGAMRFNYTYVANSPFTKTCRNLALIGRSPDKSFDKIKDDFDNFGSTIRLQDSYMYEWTLCLKRGKTSCTPIKFGPAGAGGPKTNIKLALPWSHTLTNGGSNGHRSAAICDALVNRMSWGIYNIAEKSKIGVTDPQILGSLNLVQKLAGHIDRFGRHYFGSDTTFDNGATLCQAKLNLLTDKFFRNKKTSLFQCNTSDQTLNIALCLSKEQTNITNDIQDEYDRITSAIEITGLILGSVATLGTLTAATAATVSVSGIISGGLSVTVGLANGIVELQSQESRVFNQRFITDQTGVLAKIGWVDKSLDREEQNNLIEEHLDLISKKINLGLVGFEFADFFTAGAGGHLVSSAFKPISKSLLKWGPNRLKNIGSYQMFDRNLIKVVNKLVPKLNTIGKVKLAKHLKDRANLLTSPVTSSVTSPLKEDARDQIYSYVTTLANEGIIATEKSGLTPNVLQQINRDVDTMINSMSNGVTCN